MNLEANKIKIIIVCLFFVLSFYIHKTVSDFTNNGRYEAVVVPYESGYPTVKREDHLYVLDTRTGECKRK